MELIYTSRDLQPFIHTLGYFDQPFPFNPQQRAILRAELDAWYARLYGLNRNELCYILDPTSVMGDQYPSETFRVLKDNDSKIHGDFLTRNLVLEAFDRAGT